MASTGGSGSSTALQSGIQVDSVGRVGEPSTKVIKENWAARIGAALVAIFGIAVVYLLTFGIILLAKFHGNNNQDFAFFVRDALNPFIKECATTLGTIFGSTLGFVLGYYFKEASESSNPK